MGTDPKHDTEGLRLFDTGAHSCGYWPERTARDLVLDPHDPRLPQLYPLALSWGFRRSGDIVYRPHCGSCHACVAVRVPVADFVPDRSQRRCLRRNADVEMRVVPAQRTDEQLALYQRYLAARHRGGGMDDHGAAEFEQFLVGAWANGRFLEFRAHGQLLAVAVTDRADDALSAVYTFYDPDHARRGLGTLAVLQQIAWARREQLAHLYLGYWIDGHRKMDYKRRFQPLEAFTGREWRRMEPGDDA
ncbi:arginine-tRNA-protein transferase [Luteimonas cucumeris]|uniref:Aspartate/glutamate leucyltransferase n=1 Tax=Luteimonas cucumeris TaxID=985012 RepID=A0A562KUN8_9GAMM|nr:arginyltransferase [Luteimonas cucumeris]TWH99056.1 arginine-tRNA-protein transferase [Luteimonas cucumeris]